MELNLIDGKFTTKEAVFILTQMIHVKIKFHESKISQDSNEEDMKFRENKITNLQKQLYEIQKYAEKNGNGISMNATVHIA